MVSTTMACTGMSIVTLPEGIRIATELHLVFAQWSGCLLKTGDCCHLSNLPHLQGFYHPGCDKCEGRTHYPSDPVLMLSALPLEGCDAGSENGSRSCSCVAHQVRRRHKCGYSVQCWWRRHLLNVALLLRLWRVCRCLLLLIVGVLHDRLLGSSW